MLSWLPENVSTFGGDIDSLFYFIYVIVGVWFVATQVFLFYCLFRYRRGRNGRPRRFNGATLSQMAWVLIPSALVLALDLWIDFRGSSVWARVKLEQPKPDVVVEVTGKQFNWVMTYPGPDGKFGTPDDKKLKNALHVPRNKVVRVILKSEDVIHSFFLPNLRLKQDVVPGREIPAWFKATKAGKYEIPCAELCGFGHSGMRGWLYVHTDDDYRAWVRKTWPAS